MAIVEPDVKRAMAFFDGQNLYRHAKDAFGHHHPNYDPIKLHAAVCAAQGWVPNLVRFYTGVPNAMRDPMWAPYWSNRVLSLKRQGVSVTTRPIRYHTEIVTDEDGKPREIVTPQEKGVDVRLALDVVSRARRKEYNVAVIYSQDQDLCEVVQEIKEIAKEQSRWIKVACAYPHGPNATSRRGVDGTDWIQMDQVFYDACLDPRDYRPKK
ncbi:NYN domain-containing protein [Undibacter mobilis]|uniref:NYN domain-containing protein n=1 Tax=Undibacter mobilis TaxID=2292256 RepID=A0A371BCB7_9BRAD|nr:NYN domain-containing protein [Undibacter mobilis]RDV05226.1 NYN domain-containing protein [Undibacter mobilis]